MFGWFVLFPDEYKELGINIAGGAGFFSNILHSYDNGYFNSSANTKPLHHLWSLGVEEQFYIVWPILLLVSLKIRFSLFAIIVLITLASFFLNIQGIRSDKISAFYLPHTRLWEMSLGGLLAWYSLYKRNIISISSDNLRLPLRRIIHKCMILLNRKIYRDIISIFGFLIILLSIFKLSDNLQFPGWWALLPTLGTILVIFAGADAWVNEKILSARTIVWFGLITFPLYLWHWPLLTFAHIIEENELGTFTRISIVVVSIMLAWLTYRLIEHPIRLGHHNKEKTIVLFILIFIIGFIGLTIGNSVDNPRFSRVLEKIKGDIGYIGLIDFHAELKNNNYLCTPINIRNDAVRLAYMGPDYINCFQSKPSGPIEMVIIGDSHSTPLFFGLSEVLKKTNIANYSKFSLPLLFNVNYREIFKFISDDNDIKTVIISAAWFRRLYEQPETVNFKFDLLNTVSLLVDSGKIVYISDDSPTLSFDPKLCKYDTLTLRRGHQCTENADKFNSKYEKYIGAIQDVASIFGDKVKILYVKDKFYKDNYFFVEKDGQLLFPDNGHLNIYGSRYLANEILKDHPDLLFK